MSKPPWRAQSMGDAILGRWSGPSLPAGPILPGGDEELDLDVDKYDEVYILLHETSTGGVQPIMWPMVTRVYGHDPGRA